MAMAMPGTPKVLRARLTSASRSNAGTADVEAALALAATPASVAANAMQDVVQSAAINAADTKVRENFIIYSA